MNHFVWVAVWKSASSFVGAGGFFSFIADSFRDISVDEGGFENIELRLNDGFNFEDVCRMFVRLVRFLRHFEIE